MKTKLDSRRRGFARRGTAAMETVMVTAVTLPLCILLFYLATAACRGLYQVIAAGVGWPYL